ncbi:P-loop containing nucleoside triphosphate hydrolase protein [Xylariaceae sp. FL0804]|nr:P-loop containing nucleoside triphosphate hydrolase protein [Xylariaceae sp. FL0804]
MGQTASQPVPGTKFRVIGAGLPRSGTASLSRALEILLEGPVYHCGTQNTRGAPLHMRTWTSILERTPYGHRPGSDGSDDRAFALRELRRLLDGYAAATDAPACLFVPELLRLYPDANVVCTVRDPAAWARSVDATSAQSLPAYLKVLLLPLSPMRLFPRFLAAMCAGRWGELYDAPGGPPVAPGIEVWGKHMAHLRAVVPPERLVFFDVRDGWEPLCEALGCEVPKGVEFPRVNDGDAIDAFARELMIKALGRWAVIIALEPKA